MKHSFIECYVQAKAGDFIIGEVGTINLNSGQTLQVDRQIDRQISRQIYIDRQIDRQIYRRIDKQKDRQGIIKPKASEPKNVE